MKRSSLFLASAAILMATVITSPARAATYTVDTANSGLTWGGTLLTPSFQLTAQYPGSNTTLLAGTFDANVTGPSGAETITFLGTDYIDALPLANPVSPLVGGAVIPGNDEINADGSVGTGDGLFSAGEDNAGIVQALLFSNFAFRNLAFNMGGSGTVGSPATLAELGVLEGWASASTSVTGFETLELSLITDPGANDGDIASSVGYSLAGNVETITVPFKFTLNAAPLILTINGQIVGTRTVAVIPEPTSGLFLVCLAAGAGAVVRRRRK